MPFTTSQDNAILDSMLGSGATFWGSSQEIALSTTDPGKTGSGITEPIGNGYSRVSVANNGTNWGAASSGEKTNSVDIVFPEATGSWGTLSHWAMYDSGVLKAYGILDNGSGTATPVSIGDTDVFRFQSGELRITMD